MRANLNITGKRSSQDGLNKLVGVVVRHNLSQKSPALSNAVPMPDLRSPHLAVMLHWDKIVATELADASMRARNLGLPPLPSTTFSPVVEEHGELPPLPYQAASTELRGSSTQSIDTIVAKSVVSIPGVEANPVQHSTVLKSGVATSNENAPDLVSALPSTVQPLANALRATLAVFPDAELEQMLMQWDWRSRRLARKLQK